MTSTNYISIGVSLLCSIIISALILPWLLHFCHKHSLYDLPNERKMHKNKIPRLGGTIFLPSMVAGGGAAIAITNLLGISIQEIGVSTVAMMVGTVTIYLTGMFDDVFGMGAKLKFGIQFLAAIIMPACGLYLNDLQGILGLHELHYLFAYPLTVFLILLVVNSINLIDGIDGLAASISGVALIALAFLFGALTMWGITAMCVSLLAALIVFLYFNLFGSCKRHTKTFMGDSGSLVLGYTLAYLCLKYAMTNNGMMVYRPYAVLASFTVVIVPTFDLVRVAFTRLFQGKHIFDPDKQHIHHRFAAAGFTMHQSLIAIVALQLLFCAMNAAFYLYGIDINIIIVADLLLFTAVHVWLGYRMKCKKVRS